MNMHAMEGIQVQPGIMKEDTFHRLWRTQECITDIGIKASFSREVDLLSWKVVKGQVFPDSI
jgi:hypothetical protein